MTIQRTTLRGLAATLAITALGFAATPPAFADDCPRGSLDKRYCDRDGDLTADLPGLQSDWLDPDTLIFAYTPVEDPAVYKEAWSDFLDNMEKVTGKKVVFFPVQSNAAQIEAMRSGRLHVAGFNTGSNPLAVNCAGFVSFTIMARLDDSFGYEMEIITHPASGITKVEDIKGRTLAFTSPTSNSGFKAPSAILKAEFGMVKDRDFKPTFSGKHDNSILGVANKDYDAASIANSVKARMISRGVIKESDVITIYKSQTFPTTGFGHVYNLHPDLVAKVKKAFFEFKWVNDDGSDSSLKKEFEKSKEGKFVPITYKDDWAVIREIHQRVVRDRHHTLARVPIDAAKCVQLLEEYLVEPGLFLEFAPRGLVDGFIDPDESTGQRPFALEGRQVALDQHDLQVLVVHCEDGTVDSEGGARKFVAMGHLIPGCCQYAKHSVHVTLLEWRNGKPRVGGPEMLQISAIVCAAVFMARIASADGLELGPGASALSHFIAAGLLYSHILGGTVGLVAGAIAILAQ